MKAVNDYNGQYDDELSFKTGDEIEVINEGNPILIAIICSNLFPNY